MECLYLDTTSGICGADHTTGPEGQGRREVLVPRGGRAHREAAASAVHVQATEDLADTLAEALEAVLGGAASGAAEDVQEAVLAEGAEFMAVYCCGIV